MKENQGNDIIWIAIVKLRFRFTFRGAHGFVFEVFG